MRKNLQQFHDMVTKGVKPLLSDSNYEAIQWAAIVNRLQRMQVVHKKRVF